jgi:hypothetical protein
MMRCARTVQRFESCHEFHCIGLVGNPRNLTVETVVANPDREMTSGVRVAGIRILKHVNYSEAAAKVPTNIE